MSGNSRSCYLMRTAMIRFISAAFRVVLVGLITVPPTSSLAYIRQELEEGAKVSIDEARAIALQTRAGEITTKRWNARKAAAVFATPSTLRAAA